jgi:peptidase E
VHFLRQHMHSFLSEYSSTVVFAPYATR